MKRYFEKPLAAITSISLVLSLAPAPAIAFALEEGEGGKAVESVELVQNGSGVGSTPAGGGGENAANSSDMTQGVAGDSSANTGVAAHDTALPGAEGDSATGEDAAVGDAGQASGSGAIERSADDAGSDAETTEAAQPAGAAAEPSSPDAPAEEGDGEPSLEELAAVAGQAPEPVAEEDGIALVAQAVEGWTRYAGDTALDTMRVVLQAHGVFGDDRGGTVILATANGYWDALAASGLAGIVGGGSPVVLTDGSSLSPQAAAELKRLHPEHILVMGGERAISPSVYKAISGYCPDVSRVWGERLWDTPVEIWRSGAGSWGKTAIVCTSNGYYDALSIAPYSFAEHAPIFLTGPDNMLTASALSAIQSGGFTSVLITGGPIAVSPSVEGQLDSVGIAHERIGGDTRLDTSGLLAKWELSHGLTKEHLTVASTRSYHDALAASAICGMQRSVLVLVSEAGDCRALDDVYDYGADEVVHGHIIGGPLAIPHSVAQRVTAPWALTGISAPASARAGSKASVSAAMTYGDTESSAFAYEFSWSLEGGGSSGSSGRIANPACEISLPSAGRYTVKAVAYGPDNSSQELSTTVVAYGLNGLSVSNSDESCTAEADTGVGAVSGLQLRFTWSSSDGHSGELRGWSEDTRCTFNPSSLSGWGRTYTITVEARDSSGSLGSKSAQVSPDAMTARAQGYESPTNWLIMVDWNDCWVGVYQGSKGNWQRVRYMRCSLGSGDNTPTGIFSIDDRGYSFGHGYTAYYPVDFYLRSWAFHSIIYYQDTFDVKDGRLGEHISAGCVRLALEDAKYIHDVIPYDTTVVIYR